MKYTTVLLTAILLWTLPSCTKDRNEKSSFYIDGKVVTTRQVNGSYIMGEPRLSFSNKIDGKSVSVGFHFNLSKFPTSGVFTLSYGGTNDTMVPIGIVRDGVQYFTDQHNNTKLQAYEYNAKGKYVIYPTIFYSYYPDPTNSYYIKGNDSILVSGTIYEPIDITVR